MTQRYFLQCSYKGSPFCGWQKQLNAPSVQEAIEKGLSTLLRQQIEIVGAGRTDTGVHARKYFAHFDIENGICSIPDLVYHLNKIIPYEIAIQDIFEVTPAAHARFDALSRSYEYHIITEKDPFEKDAAWLLQFPLDTDAMNEACAILMEYSDFTSFCKLHSDNKTNICRILEATWIKTETKYIFYISADRFLRNMVRAIVGTMVNIGMNKVNAAYIREIVEAKDRNMAGTSAPAHGLYFTGASYPDNIKK